MIEINELDDIEKLREVQKRRKTDFKQLEGEVKKIIEDIISKGDQSLFAYTKRFDGFDANENTVVVTKEEINEAEKAIPGEHKKIIECAAERIERFHTAFKPKSEFIEERGAILGVRVTPVESAGLYIPGGKAAYPSTALMTIIPAKIAGVKRIQIATPAPSGRANPYVLYIASLYNIDKIYKIGGAQAIAAFAYSTEIVEGVDVIAGPGNAYVALAKKLVFGDVGIDSIAGPSEVMIVADSNAKPDYLARDLLSQAEHDELAGCFLVGLDREVVSKTESLFFELASKTERSKIAKKSASNAVFVYTDDVRLAAKCVDTVAPEHLELHLEDPYMFMNLFLHAGAIFVGEFTPEPLGDYVAGPNHTLPTSTTARFFSPLSCETFMKKSSILHFSREGFKSIGECASKFAALEGLYAHKDSVDARYKNI